MVKQSGAAKKRHVNRQTQGDNQQALLDRAMLAHRQGQMPEAQALYRKVLATDSCHADALHLMGVSHYMLGEHREAIEFIEKAIRVCPHEAAYHVSLGLCLQETGMLDAAIRSFQASITLDPSKAGTYSSLGSAFQARGDMAEAEENYRRSIHLDPGYAAAHNNLGTLFSQGGLWQQAVASFSEAIRLQPDMLEAYKNLGDAFYTRKELENSRIAYERIIQINPDFAWAYVGLARLSIDANQPERAVHYLTLALEREANLPEAYFYLGRAMAYLQQWDDARFALTQAIRIKPDYTMAYNELGNILQQSRHFPEAEKCYRKAVELDPDAYQAHANIGVVFSKQGDLRKAMEHFDRALALSPGNPDVMFHRGKTLGDSGCVDEAMSVYENILELHPDYIEARSAMAYLQQVQGKLDLAEENCRRVLAKNPESISAYSCLYTVTRAQPGDAGFKILEARVKQPAGGTDDPMLLHFTLGKMYHDVGDAENAFHHYSLGNGLRAAQGDSRFSIRMHATEAAERMALFDEDFFARTTIVGSSSSRPVFVTGMPRSGTSLVEQILASHSLVSGGGELNDIADMERDLVGRNDNAVSFRRGIEGLDNGAAAILARQYLDHLEYIDPHASRIIDKMPGNLWNLWLIAILFPNARVIHCRRNPLDNCLSCYFTNFTRGHEYKNRLEDLGQYYKLNAQMMDHWKKVLPVEILDVQYEKIVADAEDQTRRLLQFCGLEWEASCLDFHETKRAVKTASSAQVRQKLYSSSIERWRPYEKYLQPLIEALN